LDSKKKQPQYGDEQIQVLEGLEAVRKRPGMYIGSTGPKGLHHLVWEIVDNSVDEHLAGICSKIDVLIHADDSITVIDNGRGIPVGEHPKMKRPTVEVVLTVLHAGGKFGGEGSSYKVSGGLHGVGSSCVNALSEHMVATVKRDGKLHQIEFQYGKVSKELHVIGKADKAESGTTIWFKPDPTIFKETTEYNYQTIFTRLRESAFLNPGLIITLTDEREKDEEGNSVTTSFCYQDGVKDYVAHIHRTKKAIHEDIVYIKGKQDDVIVEVALQYNDDFDYKNGIFSYVNNIKTADGGTHETGFKSALTKAITEYISSRQLIKGEMPAFGDDTRIGLTSVISIKVPDPQFEGQTKGKLGNTEVRPIVEQVVLTHLTQYFEENPATARIIAQRVIDAYEERMAARKAREDKRKKNLNKESSFTHSASGKLADCSSRDITINEVFIVEGDSAGGSAKEGRDRVTQGILALKGKILNVEKVQRDRVDGNAEIADMIVSIGTGIGDDFDYKALRYGKIILMTDADVDGSHIKTLLLTFFYRYMRELIEKGHIYIANPPLYGIKKGDTVLEYAWNEKQKEEALARNSKVNVQRYKGLGEMNAVQLWDTTMDPDTRKITRVTIEDVAEAELLFTTLMGDDPSLRKDYIQQKGHLATIDI
jgi:DNA gyrase subunit B